MDVAALDAALAPWRRERAARALARSRVTRSVSARRYWEARARPRTYDDQLHACGSTGRACECCGVPVVRRCNARMVCPGCTRRSWLRARRRVSAALQARLEVAKAAWRRAGRLSGLEPRLTLLTLTLAHSGDPTADRRALSEGWHRWRAWYRETYGENLTYAWAAEYTPGRDGKGHVHLHVCTMLPFRDFRVLHASWVRATHGHGRHINVSQRTRGVRDCAKYMAKYATKGVKALSVEHAARWVRAQAGMRALSTSRGFYLAPPLVRCPGSGGAHHWPRAWVDVEGWTPSHQRATPPRAGPAPPVSLAGLSGGAVPARHAGWQQLDCPF